MSYRKNEVVATRRSVKVDEVERRMWREAIVEDGVVEMAAVEGVEQVVGRSWKKEGRRKKINGGKTLREMAVDGGVCTRFLLIAPKADI